MSATPPVLGLLGAGNMASAMVRGWVRADPAMAERILVTDRGSGRAAALAERYGVRHIALERRAGRRRRHRRPVRQADRRRAGAARGVRADHAEQGDRLGRRRRAHGHARDDPRRGRPGVPVHAERRRAGRRGHARVLARAGSPTPPPSRRCSRRSRCSARSCRSRSALFDAATALSGSGPAFLGLIVEAFEDAGIVSRADATRDARAADPARRSPARPALLREADDLGCADAAAHGHLARAARRRPGWRRWSASGVRGAIIDGVVGGDAPGRRARLMPTT